MNVRVLSPHPVETIGDLSDVLNPWQSSIAASFLEGCADPNAAATVIAQTRFEARVVGFGVGIVAGLVGGAFLAFYLHGRAGGA